MKKFFKHQLLIIGCLLTIPNIAFANAGVPMLFLAMPAFAISLIPIIAIEAFYLSKKLNLPGKVAGKTAAISNLVSTFFGIPLTWFLLAATVDTRLDIAAVLPATFPGKCNFFDK